MGEQRVSYSSTVLGGPIGGVVLARDEEDAIAFCNEYAPEHLQVLAKEPFAYLGRLEHAGEILLGEHTPTTLGNYRRRSQPRAAHQRLGPHRLGGVGL